MTRKSVLLAVLLLLVAAGAIAAALAAPWVFSWAFWQEVFTLEYWQEGGVGTSRSEVFRNLGLGAIALGALIVGSLRAWSAHRQARTANEQAQIAQQGQITNIFATAVEHLGSEQLPVRLGGIYAMWSLIKDSPDRMISVVDIYCAFVRHPPHGWDSTTEIRPDVQTVLNLLGNKNASFRRFLPPEYRLDFTGADLAHAQLAHADFTGAFLWGVNLDFAYLPGTTFPAPISRKPHSRAPISGAPPSRMPTSPTSTSRTPTASRSPN